MHFARLKNHDYRGEGYDFVTFATAPRRALLSEIRAGQIRLSAEVARFLALAREGAILIGGFISPGERRVAREAAAIPRSRLVYLHPWGLSRYKPHGHAAAERRARSSAQKS